jgi:hypothetical protein
MRRRLFVAHVLKICPAISIQPDRSLTQQLGSGRLLDRKACAAAATGNSVRIVNLEGLTDQIVDEVDL